MDYYEVCPSDPRRWPCPPLLPPLINAVPLRGQLVHWCFWPEEPRRPRQRELQRGCPGGAGLPWGRGAGGCGRTPRCSSQPRPCWKCGDGGWKLRSSCRTELPASFLLQQPALVAFSPANCSVVCRVQRGQPAGNGRGCWGVSGASGAAFFLRTVWSTFCRTSCDSVPERAAGCKRG